jgi:MFS family permease
VAVLAAVILPAVLTATLAVEIGRDIPLGAGALGIAVAAFWCGAALASVPAGRLVDRFGAARGVHLAGALSAAATLGIAVIARSHLALVGFLIVAGAALALAGPGMSALVSRSMGPGRRGTALGLQQSGPPMGMLLAGLSLPALAGTVGWRWAFAVSGLLALAAAASVRAQDCRAVAVTARGDRPSGAIPLALGGGCGAAAASAALTFLVPFSADRGFGDGQSGGLVMAAAAVAITVRIALGRRADAPDGRGGAALRGDPLVEAAAVLLVGMAGFGLLATGGQAAIVLGAILAVGVGWGWTGLFVLAAVDRHPEGPGAAVGVAFTGVYVGAIAGPLLGGVLVDGTSYAAMWAANGAVVAAGAAVFAGQRRRGATGLAPLAQRGG